MKQQVTDIEMVIQPLLTRHRMLILREAGVSEDLLDADVYRQLRDTRKEYRRLKMENEKQQAEIFEKLQQISEQEKEIHRLQKEIAALKQETRQALSYGKDQHNSSMPPSKNRDGDRRAKARTRNQEAPGTIYKIYLYDL